MSLKTLALRLRRAQATGLMVLVMAPLTGACSSTQHFEWTEDVRLSDGRIIVVQRSEEYRSVTDVGAGFKQGLLFQASTIKAELSSPVGRIVSWHGSLIPLVLDVQPDKSLYLVGVIARNDAEFEWKPKPGELYVVFRLTDGNEWRRIPLADLPRTATPNLLPGGYGLFVRRGAPSKTHVDLKLKNELNSDPRLDKRYKSIIR